jgi:hypothetical protein
LTSLQTNAPFAILNPTVPPVINGGVDVGDGVIVGVGVDVGLTDKRLISTSQGTSVDNTSKTNGMFSVGVTVGVGVGVLVGQVGHPLSPQSVIP